jgi:hypothetical protein
MPSCRIQLNFKCPTKSQPGEIAMRGRVIAIALGLVAPVLLPAHLHAQVPEAIAAAAGEAAIVTMHAEGAQIYECKIDSGDKLVWQFREPIAALMIDGKTVGRHFAGPSWELADGSAVTGRVAGRAPGASSKDIPLLKLEVTSQRGAGQLTGASSIQRINTQGGVAAGACGQGGTFLRVPYSADYVFLRKGG